MELENILGYEGHTNYLHLKKALLENILSDPESTHKYHIGTQYSMPAVFDKVHVVHVKHCQNIAHFTQHCLSILLMLSAQCALSGLDQER